MFSHSLAHVLVRSSLCMSTWPGQSHLCTIQKTSTSCQVLCISRAPLDWQGQTGQADLSYPSGAISWFGVDLCFRSCLFQPPQILRRITAHCLLLLFWHMCVTHVSCLLLLAGKREGVVCVVRCSLAATLLEPGCWLLCWWVVCFSDCSLFVLTSRRCSLVLLMKTVSWEQCPLVYGHSFK